MNPPRRLRGAFGMCNLREGFVNLREGFVVAPWRLREAFSKTRSAKASRRRHGLLHLETIRLIMTSPQRVRSAAVVRFVERHVVELEKQLRMGDQHGFFQNIKLVQLEETKKVESECVRDQEGRLLRDKGRIRERWVRFFRSLLNVKSNMLDPDIPKSCRSNR